VDGPEILQLIRHDLQRAVARRGEPPIPRPLDVSPWLAMSILQKAIRRGREDLALGAAATLLRFAQEELWRRIGCIAYEDVGVASLEAVGLATLCEARTRVVSCFDPPPPQDRKLKPASANRSDNGAALFKLQAPNYRKTRDLTAK